MQQQITDANDALCLYWATGGVVSKNWGDALNPVLVSFLSGKTVCHCNEVSDKAVLQVHSVVGSHLQNADSNWIIWGTGKARDEVPLRNAPQRICAVRGPHTRDALLRQGIECPPIFGDCAIFFPAIFATARRKKYDLGIIQHIREVGLVSVPSDHDSISVNRIDIGAGLTEVVSQISQCHRIVSSSLHGIIASHAYGVPASWVKFSDIPKSNGFKFRDYFASIGSLTAKPFIVDSDTTVRDLNAIRSTVGRALDADMLLDACPLMDDDRKHQVHLSMRANYRMHDLAEG